MQVGYVLKKEMAIQSNGEVQKKSYYEMTIRVMFGNTERFTLSKNNNENAQAPYFNIYAYNIKGYEGRKQKVGALWMKSTDDGIQFMSGHIETPLVDGGKMQISLWRAKPLYDGEEISWEYDVVWKPYTPTDATTQASGNTVPVSVYLPDDISEDEIPF